MLYGRYILSKEEEELLHGIRAFPDVFSSLYAYLGVVGEFAVLKHNSPRKRNQRLIRILADLNNLRADDDVILQSRFAGCEHDSRFKNLERKHCLMHHVQQLRREVYVYAKAIGESIPYNV